MTDETLTLRDRFAMAAMNGLLAAKLDWGCSPDSWTKAISGDAYAIADAMIEARGGLGSAAELQEAILRGDTIVSAEINQ